MSLCSHFPLTRARALSLSLSLALSLSVCLFVALLCVYIYIIYTYIMYICVYILQAAVAARAAGMSLCSHFPFTAAQHADQLAAAARALFEAPNTAGVYVCTHTHTHTHTHIYSSSGSVRGCKHFWCVCVCACVRVCVVCLHGVRLNIYSMHVIYHTYNVIFFYTYFSI